MSMNTNKKHKLKKEAEDKLRQYLDAALLTLSEMFRAYRTLPANPNNPMEHIIASKNTNKKESTKKKNATKSAR